MKFPIIIYEHGDILLFTEVNRACDYLEPVDVKNNEYVAYDADGNLLELKVALVKRKNIVGITVEQEAVVIEEGCAGKDTKGLADKIRSFLLCVGVSDINEEYELSDLVRSLQQLKGAEAN